uniref:Uncharacterized protein n=1 Tax=Rhizophora mucronata TaxID=61149 RepID=A0A2P2IH91_RHIMU
MEGCEDEGEEVKEKLERSEEVEKSKETRRKMRRNSIRSWIHTSHGIPYPSIPASSSPPNSNMTILCCFLNTRID